MIDPFCYWKENYCCSRMIVIKLKIKEDFKLDRTAFHKVIMSYEQDEERRITAAQRDVSNNDRPK